MNNARHGIGTVLTIASVLATAGGCRLMRQGNGLSAGGPQAPQLISAATPASEIVAVINQNASRVQSYTAPNASFSIPGLAGVPLLRGSVVLERPKRFRLRAGTALSGDEVDLGSNDDAYWLWAKRNQPPALYFARHNETSAATAQLLPVQPTWITDALGLVQLDPAAAYQGPFPRSDGTLELRHATAGPSGAVQRVTVVEPTRAWVVEQHVYDSQGQLLASAVAKDFRYHPQAQASLPEKVTVRLPNAGLALTINTGAIAVNTPIANPQQHWAMPLMEGYPQVDLGRSNGLPIQGLSQVSPTTAAAGATAWKPPAPRLVVEPKRVEQATFQQLPPGGIAVPTTGTAWR